MHSGARRTGENFDAVKHINLDSIKSVIFTKLESSKSQRSHITYKIDSGPMVT